MKLEYLDIYDVLMDEINTIKEEERLSLTSNDCMDYMIRGIWRAIYRIGVLDDEVMEDLGNELL